MKKMILFVLVVLLIVSGGAALYKINQAITSGSAFFEEMADKEPDGAVEPISAAEDEYPLPENLIESEVPPSENTLWTNTEEPAEQSKDTEPENIPSGLPDSWQLFLQGIDAFNAERYEDARNFFNQALEADPSLQDASFALQRLDKMGK